MYCINVFDQCTIEYTSTVLYSELWNMSNNFNGVFFFDIKATIEIIHFFLKRQYVLKANVKWKIMNRIMEFVSYVLGQKDKGSL